MFANLLRYLTGGYGKGSRAQEEDLFRRTTLSSALVQEYGASVVYPMKEFVPVISCDVLAFRGSECEGSRSPGLRKEFFVCNSVTPRLDRDNFLDPFVSLSSVDVRLVSRALALLMS